MPEHRRVSIDEQELQQMAADAETARQIAALEAENARLHADLRHARIEANHWYAIADLAGNFPAREVHYDPLWESPSHPAKAWDGWESGDPIGAAPHAT